MRATPFANTSSMTSAVQMSPSQLPLHAPANPARSGGTSVPGAVSFTSAGSGVSRMQSFATEVERSSAVARKTTAKPPITRDRSPPIACRSFPHHQVIPDVDVLVDHDDPFRDDGSYAHSLSHPRPHAWPVPPRDTARTTSVSSQFGGGGVVGERSTGRSDSPRCE